MVGCDTTGTQLSTAYTVPPWFVPTFEDWDNYLDNTLTNSADWPQGTSIYTKDHTLPTHTTTKPTCTQATTTHYPTNTAINQADGAGFCYTDKNAPNCNENPYQEFTDNNARDGIQGFCDGKMVLKVDGPGVSYTVNDASSGLAITVAADWAADQSGCGSKVEFQFSGTEVAYQECFSGWNTDFYCTDLEGDLKSSFGGSYVLKTPSSGCLFLSLYAHKPSSSAKVAAAGVPPPVPSRTLSGGLASASGVSVNGTSSPWPDLVAGSSRPALFNQSVIDRLVDDFAAR